MKKLLTLLLTAALATAAATTAFADTIVNPANGQMKVTYTVEKDNADIAINSEVLKVNTDTSTDKLSAKLSFVAPKSVTYAGDYTGTVTFTVSVE